MKILIILKKFEGGVGRVVNSVKPLLEEKGCNVEVISREDDLKCFSLKKSFGILRREVKKRKYDILYTQDWSCALPFLLYKKHYVCFHGNATGKSRKFQNLVGRVMGRNVIVVGPLLKKRFPKSNMIYNGVDFKKFRDLHKKRNKIGWIKKETESITEKDFLKMAKERKLDPTIAEKIPPEKMNEWYNSLKIFVSYPPESAGFNLCWLEAKAAGVPEILGNDEGVGIENIKKHWREMSWEDHVEKLLTLWYGREKNS
jgi:hypothetical protein